MALSGRGNHRTAKVLSPGGFFLAGIVGLDILAVASGFVFAYWLRYGSPWFSPGGPLRAGHIYLLAGVCVAWVIIFASQGLYQRSILLASLDQVVALAKSATLGMLLLLAVTFLTKTEYFVEGRLVLAFAWAATFLSLVFVRTVIVRPTADAVFLSPTRQLRTLVVGTGEVARDFLLSCKENPRLGFNIVGLVADGQVDPPEAVDGLRVLGAVSDLASLSDEHEIDQIFVAVPFLSRKATLETMSKCMTANVPVKLVSDMLNMMAAGTRMGRTDGVPMLGVRESALKGFGAVGKRVFDLFIAMGLVMVLVPLFLLISVAVKLNSRGPVFFRQSRAGTSGKEFVLYKFRTMRSDTDESLHRKYASDLIGGKDLRMVEENTNAPVFKMTSDPRVTGVGNVLRKSSLDELPQLFNVIKGEMSLVGPRPPVSYELEYYKEWHKRRLQAKPGLTGLWQVSGRSSVPFDEMVLLDLYYIDHWSFITDIEILVKTVPVVLFGKGAY